MIHQLRIYEIFEHSKDARSTPASAIRRRASCGDTASTSLQCGRPRRSGEFVYLLEWPDEPTKTNAWAAYMEDREWAEIKRATSAQTGALVGDIEDRLLVPTAYSPRFA